VEQDQVLMTRLDKAGDAAWRKVDTEQIVEQLTGTSAKERNRTPLCVKNTAVCSAL